MERSDALRQLLGKLLVEEAGYRVLTAGTRSTVLEHLRSNARIDIVITDKGLGLPVWEVAQEVRWLRPGVPMIRLIDGPGDALPTYGEDPASMTLIQKPFAITELLDALERLYSSIPTRPQLTPSAARGRRLRIRERWRRLVPHLGWS